MHSLNVQIFINVHDEKETQRVSGTVVVNKKLSLLIRDTKMYRGGDVE